MPHTLTRGLLIGRTQLSQSRAGIGLRDQPLPDEKRVIASVRTIGSMSAASSDAALGDADHVARQAARASRSSTLGIDRERPEIAAVHPDHARTCVDRALAVRQHRAPSTSAASPRAARRAKQLREAPLIQRTDDQQYRVGTEHRRLDQLVFGDDEIFSEQRHRPRRRGPDEVIGTAVKKRRLGQDGNRRRSRPGIGACMRRRIVIRAQDAFRRRAPLAFRDDRGSRPKDSRVPPRMRVRPASWSAPATACRSGRSASRTSTPRRVAATIAPSRSGAAIMMPPPVAGRFETVIIDPASRPLCRCRERRRPGRCRRRSLQPDAGDQQ